MVATGTERRPVWNRIRDKVAMVRAQAPPGSLFGFEEKLGSESKCFLDTPLTGECAVTLYLAIRPSGPVLIKALLRNQPCGS